MALTKEQFLELRKQGLTVDDIINQERGTQKSVGGFVGNILTSGIQAASGVVSAITSPIQTAKALGSVALGGVQKLIPGQQTSEQSFDALVNVFKERYGTPEKFAETLYKDPVGVALDVSTVTGLGGVALKGTRLAELGTQLTRTSEIVNPITAVTSRIASKIPQTVYAPTVSEINTTALKAAEAQGIQLPASALRNNTFINQIESLAAKGAGGQGIVDRITKANADMVKIANDLVTKTGTLEDMSVVGREMASGALKFKNTWEAIKQVQYNEFNSIAGSLPANIDNTVAALRQVLSERSNVIGAKNTAPIKKLIDELVPANKKNVTPVSYTKLKNTLDREINPSTGLQNAKEAGDYKFIAEAIDKDLKATIQAYNPEAAKLLETANTTYKEGLLRLNSTYGKKIQEFAKANQYDKILPAIISPTTSVDDIPRILQLIGQENLPKIQSYVLKDIFDNAINKDGIFTQSGITKGMERYGNKVPAILNPEQLQTIKDLEVLSNAMQSSQKVAQGSQTAYLTRIAGEGGIAASAIVDLFAGNVLSFIKKITPIIGDVAMSKFLSSTAGQKILTEGFRFNGNATDILNKIGKKAGTATAASQQAERVREY